MNTPIQNNTIHEVLETMSDESLMMKMLSNLNNNDLCNLLIILDQCSEEASQRWRLAYRNIQIKW